MADRVVITNDLNVMIVDDHDPIRKAIRRVLSTMRFAQIVECFDGSDALKAIKKHPIDLVVTDLYMRKVGGFQLIQKIREQQLGYDLPIIVVTGEGSKEDIVKAVDFGADDYIVKPFQIADLERKIQQVLQKYLNPPPLLKLIRKGERLLLENAAAEALLVFEEALQMDKDSARARLGKGLALQKIGNLSDAIQVLKSSTVDQPAYYKSYAALADIFISLNQRANAIECLKSELELNPKNQNRQCILAELLLQEGDTNGSLQHYRTALRENSKHKLALMGMAKSLEANDNFEKAIYYYKRTRRHHPNYSKPLELMTLALERQGQTKMAITSLLDEIRLRPAKTDASIILAQLYIRTEQMELAVKVIDEAISRCPQDTDALRMKGKILTQNRDFDNALHLYQRLVNIEPNHTNFMALGTLLLQARKVPQAYGAFLTAGKYGADRKEIMVLLAESLKRAESPFQAFFALHLVDTSQDPKVRSHIEKEVRTLLQSIIERRGGKIPPKMAS